jgi:hypothetical protein
MKRSQNIDVTIAFTDATGAVLPITGGTIRFMIKSSPNDLDAAALLSKDTGSGVTITNGAGGIASYTITAAQADVLPFNTYLYAEGLANVGGVITRTDSNVFQLTQNIIKVIA